MISNLKWSDREVVSNGQVVNAVTLDINLVVDAFVLGDQLADFVLANLFAASRFINLLSQT